MEELTKVVQIFREADAVCFDVDSTVSTDEGIDLLAQQAGVYDAVSTLTAHAMSGSKPFEVAFKERLQLIQPTLSLFKDCLREHPPRLTKGIKELVSVLHGRSVQCFLVSGGIVDLVLPVAELVGISTTKVFANRLVFDDDGVCRGRFDEQCFTCRSKGKATAVKHIMDTHHFKCVVMVGDGVTDMEARPPAHVFVGYGGVVVREKVQQGADAFIVDFAPIAEALKAVSPV